MPALQPFPYDTKSQSRAVHRTGFARSVGGRTLRCLGVSTPRLNWVTIGPLLTGACLILRTAPRASASFFPAGRR